MAQKTVSSFSVFTLLRKESPINRYSSWISKDAFGLAPNQQYKDNVKANDQDDVGLWFKAE